MKFFNEVICLTLLVIFCYATEENKLQDKRLSSLNAMQAAAALAYSKLGQPLLTQQKTLAYAAPVQYIQQAVKYTSAPVATAAYAAPALQFQYDTSGSPAIALAYAQPSATSTGKLSQASSAPGKISYQAVPVQQQSYSLAGDVSSFSYTSPLVTYNNLGLLSQVTGAGSAQISTSPKAAGAATQTLYAQPAPAKVALAQASVSKASVEQSQGQIQPQTSKVALEQTQNQKDSYEQIPAITKYAFTQTPIGKYTIAAPYQSIEGGVQAKKVAYVAAPTVALTAAGQYTLAEQPKQLSFADLAKSYTFAEQPQTKQYTLSDQSQNKQFIYPDQGKQYTFADLAAAVQQAYAGAQQQQQQQQYYSATPQQVTPNQVQASSQSVPQAIYSTIPQNFLGQFYAPSQAVTPGITYA